MKQTSTAVKEFINHGTDEQMEIDGYVRSIQATVLTWIGIVATIGVLRLVFFWRPDWMLKCTHTKCSLDEATKVLLKDKYDQYFVEDVEYLISYHKQLPNSELKNSNFQQIFASQPVDLKYFTNKRWRYVWNEKEEGLFVRIKGEEENVPVEYFLSNRGLTADEQAIKRMLYGENAIRINLTPIMLLLVYEVLSPFYIFQIVSCILWFNDSYYYYASCIVLLSILSITITLISIRRNEKALRNKIDKASNVKVLRHDPVNKGNFIEEEVLSEDLVPGDIISIEDMAMMQCDAVLLDGAVVVNESMLTGESVPITKIALEGVGSDSNKSKDGEQFDFKINIKDHSRHILFNGTQVLQTRFFKGQRVKAVVLRTGFITTKGELVRSILYPKPVDFRFNNDTYKYVGGLAVIAFLGVIVSLTLKIMFKNPAEDVIKRTLDIITIAVPPVLPGALAAGVIFAQVRLKRQNIFCISPRTINISGTLNTFVFDKTGTLTEDGLDLRCVLPVTVSNNNEKIFENELNNLGSVKSVNTDFVQCMATCHSLTRIHNELAGDPLDCKMFEFTNYELFEPENETNESSTQMFVTAYVYPKGQENQKLGVVKQYPFSSSLQRMSALVCDMATNNFMLYCKGSPEKIIELSKPETVPVNFQYILSNYTKNGYRVIAIAKRQLNITYGDVKNLQRDSIEKNLDFIGLLIMENRLKPETTPAMNIIKDADIRVVMCTGDNLLTAISVARDCNLIGSEEKVIVIEAEPGEEPKFTYAEIVNQKVSEVSYNNKTDLLEENNQSFSHYHFAVNGKTFGVIRTEHKELLKKLAVRGSIFARMSPEQKQQLIELLQEMGYSVGMCGDGANDCGALKAAQAGISLSNTEASVASPFTSKNQNIECVPALIREGRCALVTAFGVVKFIVMYSLIQFSSVLVLYTINAGLTDFEFLYIDLILATIMIIFFSRTESYPELHKKPPYAHLIAFKPLLSLLVHFALVMGFQIFIFFYVKWNIWFEAYEDSDDKADKSFASYENTAVFTLSLFLYVSVVIVFSRGAPYRKNIFTNWPFCVCIVLCLLFNFFLTCSPYVELLDFFTMRLIPDLKYRFIIVLIGIIHFFIAFIFETYVIEDGFWIFQGKVDEIEAYHKKQRFDRFRKRRLVPYKEIEHQLRRDKQWPPVSIVNTENESTDNFGVNLKSTSISATNPLQNQQRPLNNQAKKNKNKDGLMEKFEVFEANLL